MSTNKNVFIIDRISKKQMPLILSKKIGSGGEGDVFTFEGPGRDSMCIKIYKNGMSQTTYQKLSKMTSHPAAIEFTKNNICWPVAIIHDMDTQSPIGYMMPLASSNTIKAKSLFLPTHRKKSLSSISRSDMCDFLEYWLTAVKRLQDHNILIGDINEQNVLVDPTNMRSYLVDCDSFQINDFPCPVGTPEFLAPELQGHNLKDHLRTADHENFAIAVFIFKALVGGINPFAVKQGSGVAENIKNGNFPYPYAEVYQPDFTPAGNAEIRWKHISMDLKGLFYQTFKQNKRATPSEWYKEILAYRNSIKKGEYTDSLDSLKTSDVDTRKKSGNIDEARQRKPKGVIRNNISEANLGPYIGILELSTRAVKSMTINVPELWNGFKWKSPYFTNNADLTHTGQLLNHEKMMNLSEFRKVILPVIEKHLNTLKKQGCTHIYAIATAAYRGSKNNDQILELLKKIDLDVMILTRDQEADYTSRAFRWAQTSPKEYENRDILLIDQGGGSTEVSLLDPQGKMIQRGNIPLGTESATNSLYTNFTDSRSFKDILIEAPKYLRRTVNDNTLDVVKAIKTRPQAPIIVGLGTAITKATNKKTNASQHNTIMTKDAIDAFIQTNLSTLQNQQTISNIKELYAYIENHTFSKRKRNEVNYYDRLIHYLGCVMYMHLLDRFEANQLVVSGSGLRYGVAHSALEELSQEYLKVSYGVGSLPKTLENQLKELSKPVEYQGVKEGDVINGNVINVADFGVFVNLGSVDGLLHISQYPKHFDPDDLYRGESIKVKVHSIKPDFKKAGKMKIDLRLVDAL